MKHGNVVPRMCAVCSAEIPAGVGRFLAAAPGEPVTKFFHAGSCAVQAGAVPGSAVAWGEIAEWVGAAIEEREPVVTTPEGFAVVDLLIVAVQVAALAVAALFVVKAIVAHGGF